MAEGNWIKLYRKMIDDPAFVNSTPAQVKVLITVMFLAAWTPKKWDVLGHEFTIQPGEVFISSLELARRAGDGVSRKVVRAAMERFEKLGFWSIRRTKRGMLIHIVNWRKYQLYDGEEGQSKGQSRANGGPVEGQSRANGGPTNKKEYKNSKNVRREKKTYTGVSSALEKFAGNNQALLDALKEWAEMRKRLKKPLTEKAANLNLKDLQNLSGGDEQKMVAIVLQSVKRSWQGFYALKEEQAPAPAQSSVEDFIHGIEGYE